MKYIEVDGQLLLSVVILTPLLLFIVQDCCTQYIMLQKLELFFSSVS